MWAKARLRRTRYLRLRKRVRFSETICRKCSLHSFENSKSLLGRNVARCIGVLDGSLPDAPPRLFKVKQVVCEWKLLPVRYEEPLTALLRFIGRVVVPETKDRDRPRCRMRRRSLQSGTLFRPRAILRRLIITLCRARVMTRNGGGYWIVPKPNGRSSGTDHPKARDQASDTPCRHSSTAARRPDFGLALGASTKTLTLKFPCHLNRFAKENAWWRRSQNSREGIGVNVL